MAESTRGGKRTCNRKTPTTTPRNNTGWAPIAVRTPGQSLWPGRATRNTSGYSVGQTSAAPKGDQRWSVRLDTETTTCYSERTCVARVPPEIGTRLEVNMREVSRRDSLGVLGVAAGAAFA